MKTFCHALMLTLLAVGGCDTDSPAVQADAGSEAGAPDPDSDGGTSGIAWGACPDRFRDQCATLNMPLNHADPDGKSIEVFISRGAPGSRQLWLLQGGPGASAESFFGLHEFLRAVDPELEIYTIEHRGVGDSTRLGCESGEDGTSPGGTQIVDDEWDTCRDELVKTWGDDLAYFSTTQAAHDLALAIERTRKPDQQVFVYGGSYGTYWANRYAVLHPEQPTGVILDAPVQPGAQLARYDLAFEPIGRQLFGELCAQAEACTDKLGPDPLAFFDETYAALTKGSCPMLGVGLDTWRVIFGVSLMDYNLRNWLPAIVYRLNRCSDADKDAIGTLLNEVFIGGEGVPRTSSILQLHVLLSEFWSPELEDETALMAARESNAFFQDAVANVFRMQASWPRYDMDEKASDYAPANVPILTLAGELDPAAPPALVGVGFRENLRGPHQTYVEIPYGTHTVLTTSPVKDNKPACPVQLVRAFIADPTSELPVACTEQVLAPTFTAPAEISMRFFGSADLYE